MPGAQQSCVCSVGEINFNVIGVMFQLSSIITESIRLVLVQILLQVTVQHPHLPQQHALAC